jgi:hypothetical protein
VVRGFRRSGVPCIIVEKHHPCLRMSGHRNSGTLSVGYYEGPGAELPRLLVKLGLVGLFNFYPFTMCVHDMAQLPGEGGRGHFYRLLYIVACGDRDFHFISSSQPLTLSLSPAPSLLRPVSFNFSTDLSDGGSVLRCLRRLWLVR